jgi:hypothetical protein
MNKRLYHYFTDDHRRIEAILEKAMADPDNIVLDLYHEFRVGLLTHIKMEEKILFLAAQEANGGEPLPIQAQLRLEHGALTSLVVLPPTVEVVKVITALLDRHDEREEEPGGMYDACEILTKHQTDEILARLAETTPVPVHPPNPSPKAVTAAKNSLIRAGYSYEVLAG